MGEDFGRKHREQIADAMAFRYIEKEGNSVPSAARHQIRGLQQDVLRELIVLFLLQLRKEIAGYEHFCEKLSLFDLEPFAEWENQMNANF